MHETLDRVEVMESRSIRKWLWAALTASAIGVDSLQIATGAANFPIRGTRARVVHKSSIKATLEPADGGGYYVSYVTSPSGERVPIMNIPGNVKVVPRQLMDDQQATTVCGALRNVSGVIWP